MGWRIVVLARLLTPDERREGGPDLAPRWRQVPVRGGVARMGQGLFFEIGSAQTPSNTEKTPARMTLCLIPTTDGAQGPFFHSLRWRTVELGVIPTNLH